MAKFIFIYHGGTAPEGPEAQAKVMEKWQAWLGSLDTADIGAPLGESSTVHSNHSISADGGSNPASGYSLVNAADKAAALEAAKGCPILEEGGSVEVAEALAM